MAAVAAPLLILFLAIGRSHAEADPFLLDLRINGGPGDEIIVHDYDGWMSLDTEESRDAIQLTL